MSQIEVGKPLVKSIDSNYSKQLLEFNGFDIINTVGSFHKVQGFDNYNRLIDINSVFSNRPRFEPVDRTGQALGPIRYAPERSWKIPVNELSLETALELRVQELCNTGQPLNLMWSGGIDSTAIVVAFLKYAPDLQQCRVFYSPWSTYEHPEFYQLLQNITQVELIDISGDFYLGDNIDGIFVSGNTSDEIHGSLDQSFFEHYGYDFLFSPWQDFFRSRIPNDDFIEFCEQHFSAAGRDIKTVFEARWWFYACCKLTSILNIANLAFFSSGPTNFNPNRLIGFFDCDVYEQFIFFNTDRIIANSNYASWRQFLKDFCYSYDGFDEWRVNKAKFGSSQIQIYTYKKQILNNARNLMLLENGQRVSTANLPFFSKLEWECIQQDYQYVFRQPNSV